MLAKGERFTMVSGFQKICNRVKQIGFSIKSKLVANLSLLLVTIFYLFPVIFVIGYATQMRLPCELNKNYEVTRFCGKCTNTFKDGVYDFECNPRSEREAFFLNVLMANRHGIADTGLNAWDYLVGCINWKNCRVPKLIFLNYSRIQTCIRC